MPHPRRDAAIVVGSVVDMLCWVEVVAFVSSILAVAVASNWG